MLALLPGRVTEADTGAGPGVDPAPGPDPAPETTPQGVFQFSVPVSGWGAESYRLHWGDESVEIAQSRSDRASLADIETALESLHGIRDVEVTTPGLADIIEGTGGRPYRVAIIDADPDTFRVTKGNGKNASVRIVDDDDDTAPAEPGASPDNNNGGPVVFEIMFDNPAYNRNAWSVENTIFGDLHFLIHYDNGETHPLDRETPQYQHLKYDNLASGLEAAFESLPIVASAEVVITSEAPGVIPAEGPLPQSDKWRIELTTEGPGVVSGLTYQIEYSYPNPPEYGGGESGTHYGFINPIQQGAAQFQFDAVTSGALTPGVAEMDGADDAGADPGESVPAVDAWPWAVHLADPAGHDLLI